MLDIYQIFEHCEQPVARDRLLGRVLVTPERSFILEDYHDFVLHVVRESPGIEALASLRKLAQNPHFVIKPMGEKPPAPVIASDSKDLERKWSYCLPDQEPKLLLLMDNKYHLDGKPLETEELAQIVVSLENGGAHLKSLGVLRKGLPLTIAPHAPKIEESKPVTPASTHPEDILAHLESLVGKHGIEKQHVDSLRDHIFKDPMTGLGNRKAWEQFASKNKPGIYASLDLNHLKELNDAHGHLAGDDGIRAFGQALHTAADHAGREGVKVARVGGDEVAAHFETPDHAHRFMHKLHEALKDTQPVAGDHKISTSIGFGSTYADADKALYHAKMAKAQHLQEKMLPIAQTPNFAHSLVPGAEGPIKLK